MVATTSPEVMPRSLTIQEECSGLAITHRVPESPTLHGAHPPADGRTVDAEIAGDLVLGVATLRVHPRDTNRLISRIKM